MRVISKVKSCIIFKRLLAKCSSGVSHSPNDQLKIADLVLLRLLVSSKFTNLSLWASMNSKNEINYFLPVPCAVSLVYCKLYSLAFLN